MTQHWTDLHQMEGDGGITDHRVQLCENLQHKQEVVVVCFRVCSLRQERPLLENSSLWNLLTTEKIKLVWPECFHPFLLKGFPPCNYLFGFFSPPDYFNRICHVQTLKAGSCLLEHVFISYSTNELHLTLRMSAASDPFPGPSSTSCSCLGRPAPIHSLMIQTPISWQTK